LQWMICKYKDCLEKLNNYQTVGTYLSKGKTPHFPGNFWWTTTDYLKLIPNFDEYIRKQKFFNQIQLNKRYLAEFWPLSKGYSQAYAFVENSEINKKKSFLRTVKNNMKKYIYNICVLFFPNIILNIKKKKWSKYEKN
jgi:hypothetical protein